MGVGVISRVGEIRSVLGRRYAASGDADRWDRRRRRRGWNVDRKITPRTIIAVTGAGIIHYRNDCVGSLLRLFRGY